MTGDDVAGAFFLTLLLSLIGLGVWTVVTDEYSVKEVSTCTESKITYKCMVQNGETLFLCDTIEECNKKCEVARNK